MYGTCLLTPVQKLPNSETVTFSFYSDIINNEEVLNVVKEISDNMKLTMERVIHCVVKWRKFQNVWKEDKAGDIAKWASVTPPLVAAFDLKFHIYW